MSESFLLATLLKVILLTGLEYRVLALLAHTRDTVLLSRDFITELTNVLLARSTFVAQDTVSHFGKHLEDRFVKVGR